MIRTGDQSEQPHEVPSQDPAIRLQSVSASLHPGDIVESTFAIAQRFQWPSLSAMSGQNVQATKPTTATYENTWLGLSVRVQQM